MIPALSLWNQECFDFARKAALSGGWTTSCTYLTFHTYYFWKDFDTRRRDLPSFQRSDKEAHPSPLLNSSLPLSIYPSGETFLSVSSDLSTPNSRRNFCNITKLLILQQKSSRWSRTRIELHDPACEVTISWQNFVHVDQLEGFPPPFLLRYLQALIQRVDPFVVGNLRISLCRSVHKILQMSDTNAGIVLPVIMSTRWSEHVKS